MKPELLYSLKGYTGKDLAADLMSGLLVAIIALPMSVAMGIQSGVSAQAGLISAIIGGFLIAFLSGSRFSIGGPSATFITLTVVYLATPGIGILGMQLITIMAGVILIAAGFLKAGKALKYVPYPIVIGFTTGIGVILLIGQIKDFFGLTLGSLSPDIIEKLIKIGQNINTFNPASFAVGAFTLVLIYVLPKLHKKIPAVFVALILGTLLSYILQTLFEGKVEIVLLGELNVTFDFINFSAISEVNFLKLIIPAFLIAVLSALEGLLSATVAEGMTNYIHDPNMELIGHGAANMGSGLFGGIPVTGAIARTSANIGAGAKSPVSGIAHSLILLLMYIALMPVMKFVPYAVLAAILIKVSITMSKFKQFSKFIVFGIRDSIILLSSFLCTVFLGVAYGLLAGIAAALLLNINNFRNKLVIEPTDISSELQKTKKFRTENKKAFSVSGAVFFVSINKLIAFIKTEIETTDEIDLDMGSITSIDATSVERLAKLAKSISKKNKRLYLYNLQPQVKERYRKAFEDIIIVW